MHNFSVDILIFSSDFYAFSKKDPFESIDGKLDLVHISMPSLPSSLLAMPFLDNLIILKTKIDQLCQIEYYWVNNY